MVLKGCDQCTGTPGEQEAKIKDNFVHLLTAGFGYTNIYVENMWRMEIASAQCTLDGKTVKYRFRDKRALDPLLWTCTKLQTYRTQSGNSVSVNRDSTLKERQREDRREKEFKKRRGQDKEKVTRHGQFGIHLLNDDGTVRKTLIIP